MSSKSECGCELTYPFFYDKDAAYLDDSECRYKKLQAEYDQEVISHDIEEKDLKAQILQLKEETEELNATFDLQWKADMRAVAMWRDEAPKERELTLPDRTDHVMWLLKKVTDLEKQLKELGLKNGSLDTRHM